MHRNKFFPTGYQEIKCISDAQRASKIKCFYVAYRVPRKIVYFLRFGCPEINCISPARKCPEIKCVSEARRCTEMNCISAACNSTGLLDHWCHSYCINPRYRVDGDTLIHATVQCPLPPPALVTTWPGPIFYKATLRQKTGFKTDSFQRLFLHWNPFLAC